MKLSEHRDPWNTRKTEIDPWDSPWRKKYEEALMQGKNSKVCAFSEQEHSHGGKNERRFPISGRSIYQQKTDRRSASVLFSPALVPLIICAGLFVVFLLYALVHLIAIFAYNESLFMYLFWTEYMPPLLLLGGLSLFFLGRWRKKR